MTDHETGQTPEWLEDPSSESLTTPQSQRRFAGSPIPAMAALPELSSQQEALAERTAPEPELVLVETNVQAQGFDLRFRLTDVLLVQLCLLRTRRLMTFWTLFYILVLS